MPLHHHGDYELDPSLSRIDFDTVTAWLASSYWSPGVPRTTVEKAARNSSFVLGAYAPGGAQAGYLRVVSDRTTFAWLADVWVDAPHRRRGLAQAMVRRALADPDHQQLRRWMLITRDAHPLYRQCGFDLEPKPETVMLHRPAAG